MTTPEILDILRKFKYAFSQRFGIKSLGISVLLLVLHKMNQVM